MKPLGKVKIQWTPNFAYIIGLITSDGNLSNDGRHINFTSKDLELVILFKHFLKIKNKISKKRRSHGSEKKYFFIQFGDINFYKFLVKTGLKPNKSRNLTKLNVPRNYFFDFLRGVFDGDGSIFSYFDKRWKNSFMFYLAFSSASPSFVTWLRKSIETLIRIKGHVSRTASKSTIQLKYGKKESNILIKKMYYKKGLPFLVRKYHKIKAILEIEEKIKINVGRVLKLADSCV